MTFARTISCRSVSTRFPVHCHRSLGSEADREETGERLLSWIIAGLSFLLHSLTFDRNPKDVCARDFERAAEENSFSVESKDLADLCS